MSLVKWAFIGVLALPVAELGVFILVASTIGWLPALALFLGTSFLGIILLKRSGLDHLARFRAALAQEGVAAIHLETPGVAHVLGGILLVFPGFITDFIGLLLFVPPLRRTLAAAVGHALRNRARRARRQRDPSLIDLEPDEWHQVANKPLEDGRPGRRRPRAGR